MSDDFRGAERYALPILKKNNLFRGSMGVTMTRNGWQGYDVIT